MNNEEKKIKKGIQLNDDALESINGGVKLFEDFERDIKYFGPIIKNEIEAKLEECSDNLKENFDSIIKKR